MKIKEWYKFGFKIGNVKLLRHMMPNSSIVLKLYHKTISAYLEKKLSDAVIDIQKYSYDSVDIKDDCPIWIFWNSGFDHAPVIVQKCISSIWNHAGNHKVYILTDENIDDYIEIPKILVDRLEENKITIAFYADFIRVSLLKKYGGIWMDATLFMTHPFDNELYTNSWYSLKNDEEVNPLYISNLRWTLYFLCASEKSIVIDAIHRLMIENVNKIDGNVDYFTLDYLIEIAYRNNSCVKKIIDGVPNNNRLGHNYLADNLHKDYDEIMWKKETTDKYLFKLSYKEFDEKSYSKNSLYAKVVQPTKTWVK